MRVIQALNNYFFDVEENESSDWVSAMIFYGSCGILALTSVVYTIINVLN